MRKALIVFGALVLAGCGGSSAPASGTPTGDAICNRALERVVNAGGISAAAEALDMAVTVCDTLEEWKLAAAASPQALPAGEDPGAWVKGYCARTPKLQRFPLCIEAAAQ
jgi:hypothetical protein